jgi:hypothetical protein
MMTANGSPGQGWIKLHRQSLHSRVWKNTHLWHLWTYCLLRANHKPTWVSVKTGRGETEEFVDAGQFVFGSKSAARALGAKWQTTYKRLKKLETMGNLRTQSKAHCTIVTICNWGTYQNGDGLHEKARGDPSIASGNEKKKFSPDSEEFRLSKLLLDLILERKSSFRKPDLQKWAVHVDRLIRLDKRTPDQIESVIRWCQQDSFWQNNILSTHKLRDQLDQLELRMEAGGGKSGTETTAQRAARMKREGTWIE